MEHTFAVGIKHSIARVLAKGKQPVKFVHCESGDHSPDLVGDQLNKIAQDKYPVKFAWEKVPESMKCKVQPPHFDKRLAATFLS